jgi:DNA-binding CsgD family transcriptional regulator
MSRISWSLGHAAEAQRHSTEAVTILEKLPAGPELAMAYSTRAQLHMLCEESQPAVLWGTRAIDLAEKLDATETLVHALNNVGTAELFVRNEEGRIKLEESLRLALENNFQEHAARAFTNLAFSALRDRNYQLAMRYFDDGLAYMKEHDLDWARLYLTACRARANFEQGFWDSAAADAESVLRHHRGSVITRIPALVVLGYLRVRRGDPDVAQPLAEAYELATQTKELQRIAPVVSARIEFAWLKGHFQQVIDEARQVLDQASGQDHPWLKEEFAFWIWRSGGAPKVNKSAVTPYALQMSGKWRAAAERWREIGCPYEEAMALADGDESGQREALEIFERLGAGPATEKLRQAMRATGIRGLPRGPRSSTKENPAGLTNRQLEVLALMAEGASNATIGERLFISAKTVDHHVSAILAKLETHTRAEAVSLALQSGLLNKDRERSPAK